MGSSWLPFPHRWYFILECGSLSLSICRTWRGSQDQIMAVSPFHLLWRKCVSITRMSGGRKVATMSPDLPVERLVISHGEILNTWKSQMQQPC